MALDDPALVVPLTKFRKGLPQLLNCPESPHPEPAAAGSFSVRMNRSMQPFPSGCRTNAGGMAPAIGLLASASGLVPLRSELPRAATGPTPCDGPRHRTAMRPTPRGSSPSVPHRSMRFWVTDANTLAQIGLSQNRFTNSAGAEQNRWSYDDPHFVVHQISSLSQRAGHPQAL